MLTQEMWGQLRFYYFNYLKPYPYTFSASLVYPRLWVGDLTAAFDLPALTAHGITHIVDLVPGISSEFPGIRYLHLPCLDADAFNMTPHFDMTNTFIHDALTSNDDHRVLIHCSVGRSRSVTVAMAYRMFTTPDTTRDILAHVQAKRPIAQPNPGFMAQLRRYRQHVNDLRASSPTTESDSYSSDYESDVSDNA